MNHHWERYGISFNDILVKGASVWLTLICPPTCQVNKQLYMKEKLVQLNLPD